MFEISWSEILIVGIVALIFIGPKDMPVLFRAVGRYIGIVKRQVEDVRDQFNLAMKEIDLERTRQDLEKLQASVDTEVTNVRSAFDDAIGAARKKQSVQSPEAVPKIEDQHAKLAAP